MPAGAAATYLEEVVTTVSNENRDLRNVESAIKGVAASADRLAEAQEATARSVSTALKRKPLANVAALSKSEVDELRRAVSEGSPEATAERVSADPVLRGMYEEMSLLGLAEVSRDIDGTPSLIFVTALGTWAVERRRQLDAEELERERREKVWTLFHVLLGVIVGWLLGKF